MKKRFLFFAAFAVMLLSLNFTAQAASYSSAWYVSNGSWYIKGPNGQALRGAWVCDNAAGPGSADNWYLIDTNGQMVTAPLVVDAGGYYYSLETNHNGNYGMLRHTNGTYDGIYLSFNQVHNGSFGAITNVEGINALKAKYGVTSVAHISSSNCYYTSSYVGNFTTSTTTYNNDRTYTLNFYVNGSKWKSTTSNSNGIYVKDYGSYLLYWEDRYTGDSYYPGDYYYFSNGRTTASLDAVFYSGSGYSWDTNTSTLYEIYYYLDGSCILHDTSFSNPMLVKDIGYGALEKYVTSEGNAIYPGQYYSFDYGTSVASLTAILATSDYALDNDGVDYGPNGW